MPTIEQTIRGFVVDNFLFGESNREPGGEESFLELGIIDSTGVLELVTFIESTFGLKVADAELVPDNLDTVNSLVTFIRRKTGRAD